MDFRSFLNLHCHNTIVNFLMFTFLQASAIISLVWVPRSGIIEYKVFSVFKVANIQFQFLGFASWYLGTTLGTVLYLEHCVAVLGDFSFLLFQDTCLRSPGVFVGVFLSSECLPQGRGLGAIQDVCASWMLYQVPWRPLALSQAFCLDYTFRKFLKWCLIWWV